MPSLAAPVTAERSSSTVERSISPSAATVAVVPSRVMRMLSSSSIRAREYPLSPGGLSFGWSMADDHHDHDHGSELSETQIRVRALESALIERGLVDPAALDALIETYETKVGPHNGARVVAKAWTDTDVPRSGCSSDATAAIAELGYIGPPGRAHGRAGEHARTTHHMVVCTLCSCYPWPVLGLPPVWYKSAPYRSRAVSEPRAVLADFGVTLPAETEIRVWDSTAEVRYLVVPMRPARHRGLGRGAAGGASSRATR